MLALQTTAKARPYLAIASRLSFSIARAWRALPGGGNPGVVALVDVVTTWRVRARQLAGRGVFYRFLEVLL